MKEREAGEKQCASNPLFSSSHLAAPFSLEATVFILYLTPAIDAQLL